MNARTQATFDELRGGLDKARLGRDPLTQPAQALYDPSNEHDSCGVGFVADMKNRKSHDILEKGLQILINLDHRGAVGRGSSLGRRCGVLTQIPTRSLRRMRQAGFDLPARGHYAIGQFFMPR
jgi:glutamate synthase (NADPH/NADH) large chain